MAARTSQATRKRSKQNVLPLIAGAIIIGACIIRFGAKPAEAVSAPAPSVVAEFDTVSVPVPSEPVPAGTRISAAHFRWVSFPKHQVPEGAILDIAEVRDSYSLSALPANLPLFRTNLTHNSGGTNPVTERIPPGMRAMTIHVDATTAVEGWAGSGSLVDVLLIEKDHTTVVAEKVKILSAERSVAPVAGSATPNVPTTITMLVSQEQCLAINTAIPLGRIAFALRSTNDEEKWDSTTYNADRLKGGSSVSAPHAEVNGYISVKGSKDKSFALSNGKWIKTESIPDGFFPGASN